VKEEQFRYIFEMCVNSNAGEPGFYWTNDEELGSNPCVEIALNSNQFCNLSTINQTGIEDKKDWLNRVYAATLLGTLQAAYTDFPYLRPIWKSTTEAEALLGVSCTGIADAHGKVTADWLQDGAKLAKEVNEKYARKLGINPAARITAIKPEGTASCILGSSSGIHARHDDYYLRRVRMNKDDALALYLKATVPELVEDDIFSASGVVVTIPQESPEKAIIRSKETAESLFNRTVFYHDNWIKPGHVTGKNTHNVSVTISYKPEEVDTLFNLLWNHRDNYTGISLLPYDNGTYKQAPFESCDKETFEKFNSMVKSIDLTQVFEESDGTTRAQVIACAGGACEVT
jgi:ribonucleoside-diphosphate reductase alpha chain